MSDQVDKRVDLFKTYIDLTILNYRVVKNKNLDYSLKVFSLQLSEFTNDIAEAANRILKDFATQNPGEEELLKTKLTDIIKESRIRFSKQK